MSKNKKRLLAAGAVYLVLWVLTWTWGLYDVDKAFDAEFALAHPHAFYTPRDSETVATVRLSRFNVRQLDDPANFQGQSWFRYRSRGFAIAPFVILDKAAWVDGPFSGFGGQRVVLWFFGATTWFSYRAYWVM